MQLRDVLLLALVDVVVALLAAVAVAQVVEGVSSFKLVGDTWALRLSWVMVLFASECICYTVLRLSVHVARVGKKSCCA